MLSKNSPKFGYDYWGEIRRKSMERTKLKKASVKSRLKVWFDYWTKKFFPKCEECDAPIGRDSDSVYGCQAHIVPKSLFESVCDDLDNHMTLGRFCCCHGRFDASWESAMKMKIWPTAVERFKKFAHKIPVEEARKLPDELRQYCNV